VFLDGAFAGCCLVSSDNIFRAIDEEASFYFFKLIPVFIIVSASWSLDSALDEVSAEFFLFLKPLLLLLLFVLRRSRNIFFSIRPSLR
jgi:hypothetical protein